MKKVYKILILLLLSLFLVSCSGEKSGTKVYVSEEFGVKGEVIIEYDEDKITKYTIVSNIPYDVVGITSIDQAKEFFKERVDSYKQLENINLDVEYKDNEAIETLVYDYANLDFNKIKGLSNLKKDKDGKEYVSLKKTEKSLKKDGYKKK